MLDAHNMRIVIDSTEYKRDRGLNKENLSLIKDMGKENLISLHIPYFVYKECSSSSVIDLKSELNKIQVSLKSFVRKGMNDTDYETARKIAFEIKKLHDNSQKSNELLWEDFVDQSNAILYKFDPEESTNVVNAYFEGLPPFKSVKSRNDIPDAFIYQTIEKLSQEGEVHLISGDENLRDKCNDLKTVNVHSTFQELYENESFKVNRAKYEVLKANQRVTDAKNILLDNLDQFEIAASEFIHRLDSLSITDLQIPSDDNQATIEAIDYSKTSVDTDNIQFIDDKFYVHVEIKGNASISYAVYKPDYWILEPAPSIVEDLNRHYFLCEDSLDVIIKKTFSIDIDDLKEDEELEVEMDGFDEIIINHNNVANTR